MTPDPRLYVCTPDLADARLMGQVTATRFVEPALRQCLPPMGALRRDPDWEAPLVAYALAGDLLEVFAEEGDWLLVRCVEAQCVGWMRAEGTMLSVAAPTHHVTARNAFLYTEPRLAAPVADCLPMNAGITVTGETGQIRMHNYTVDLHRLDLGLWIVAAATAPLADRGSGDRAARLVAAAGRLLGVPFLPGGNSSFGLDAGGLIQCLLRQVGVDVPPFPDLQRDRVGTGVAATDPAALAPGDLLFQADGAALYLGDGQVIRADRQALAVRRTPLGDLGRDLSTLTVRRLPG